MKNRRYGFDSKLVRLKENRRYLIPRDTSGFDSKLVRLKGLNRLKKILGRKVSIPNWFD